MDKYAENWNLFACDKKLKKDMTQKKSKINIFGFSGFTEQLRIEESTVKENDFELPLTLDEVMSEINKKYYEPALMNSVLKVLEDTGIISPSNPKKYVAWRSLKVLKIIEAFIPNYIISTIDKTNYLCSLPTYRTTSFRLTC